jgi:hypothetical protein
MLQRNAQIISASINRDDHGCLTIWLDLDYGSSVQGFGGYNLYSPAMTGHLSYCGWFIWRLLQVFDVQSFEDIEGLYVRVEGDNGRINRIGHITEERWFEPSAELKTLEK